MAFAGGAGMLPTQSFSNRSVEYVSNRDVYLSVTPEVSTANGESSYYKRGELY